MTRQELQLVMAARSVAKIYKAHAKDIVVSVIGWLASVVLAASPILAILILYVFVYGIDDNRTTAWLLGLSTIVWTLCAMFVLKLTSSQLPLIIKSLFLGLSLVCVAISMMIFVVASLYSYSPVRGDEYILFLQLNRNSRWLLLIPGLSATVVLIMDAATRIFNYSKSRQQLGY